MKYPINETKFMKAAEMLNSNLTEEVKALVQACIAMANKAYEQGYKDGANNR